MCFDIHLGVDHECDRQTDMPPLAVALNIIRYALKRCDGAALDKWTKIGVHIGIWLGNNLDNVQLHRFTRSENIAKSFRGLLF